MSELRLVNVGKVYADGTVALHEVDLVVADGELVVLTGPPHSGLTTLLRVVAGFEELTSGEVWIGDRRVDGLAAGERDVAMVLQNYAIYPHLTVAENMGLALQMQRVRRDEIERRVRVAADVLGLAARLDRLPPELTSTERHRVGLGRAIVREPAVFLLDDALAKIDGRLRDELRACIVDCQRAIAATMVYATHDHREVAAIGGRAVVLESGVSVHANVQQPGATR